MKIAIQGHPTRGKEIIQILESLGGKKLYYSDASDKYLVFFINDKGHISCLNRKNPIAKEYHKIYTLEEFEKEFPFKVGDKVIHKEFNDLFEVIAFNPELTYPYKIKGVCEFNTKSYILTKWQPKMKEERFVTLTLDKAKEWYNKGGELREIALQAFTKKELNPLPRSWEEFCKQSNPVASWRYNIPIKYETLFKLEQLRDCWRQGWKPDWMDGDRKKYAIKGWRDKSAIEIAYVTHAFLSFPTYELALEFQECFRDLIEKAGDLI